MKMPFSKILRCLSKHGRLLAGVSLLLPATIGAGGSKNAPTDYVAHEWGTFTSVQGGDGELLTWRPLETSRLPGFVYDWAHPGLKRRSMGALFRKEVMVSLQRMETPVIYFYSSKPQTIDVSVKFPSGKITEWYPQVEEIGPSFATVPPAVSEMDSLAHKAGASPSFSFNSWLVSPPINESRIRWANVHILPHKPDREVERGLPFDRSGSHYFAARETDSNLLESHSATNSMAEHEKFIFYRGVGNFQTPLQVFSTSSNDISVANRGEEALKHLFVLNVSGQTGKFGSIEKLVPGERQTVLINPSEPDMPLSRLSEELGGLLAQALVKEGLYEREARAMIKTWDDSWFKEEGLRVLYILPRPWTDATLPLALNPPAKDLVRMMVGRAEVISPSAQQALANNLIQAANGDSAAAQMAMKQFKSLGRFAEPALLLATKGQKAEILQVGAQLLRDATAKPTQTAKAF